MIFLLIISILLFLAGSILLIYWYLISGNLGILKNKYFYADSSKSQTPVLYSKTLNLSGKPDYLIKKNGIIFPVEVKTGLTPDEPYQNHVMQLIAYCLLVEENFGQRPFGGFLKYPKKEFKIAYTEEAKNNLKEIIGEMLLLKVSGRQPHCDHIAHN